MFDVNNIVRENIKSLQSYHVWRDDYLDNNDAVFLDNCENNFGSPLGKGYERYPSSSQSKLKQEIADYKKLNASNVAIGNGSDELIDLLIRCFCEPDRDNILIWVFNKFHFTKSFFQSVQLKFLVLLVLLISQ